MAAEDRLVARSGSGRCADRRERPAEQTDDLYFTSLPKRLLEHERCTYAGRRQQRIWIDLAPSCREPIPYYDRR